MNQHTAAELAEWVYRHKARTFGGFSAVPTLMLLVGSCDSSPLSPHDLMDHFEVVAKYVYDTGDVNDIRHVVAAFLFTP